MPFAARSPRLGAFRRAPTRPTRSLQPELDGVARGTAVAVALTHSGSEDDAMTTAAVGAEMAVDDPLFGRIVGAKYEIEERIGAGAMGVVYRARHVTLDKVVALKIL